MRCSAQALVTLVKAKLRFSRFPKEPELSKRAKSASCKQTGRRGLRTAWGCGEHPETLSVPTSFPLSHRELVLEAANPQELRRWHDSVGWAKRSAREGGAVPVGGSGEVEEKAFNAVTHTLSHQVGCSEATSLPQAHACVHAWARVCVCEKTHLTLQAAACAHFPHVKAEAPLNPQDCGGRDKYLSPKL